MTDGTDGAYNGGDGSFRPGDDIGSATPLLKGIMTYKRYVVEVRDPNRTLRRISVMAVSANDAESQITPLNPSAEVTVFEEVETSE